MELLHPLATTHARKEEDKLGSRRIAAQKCDLKAQKEVHRPPGQSKYARKSMMTGRYVEEAFYPPDR